MEILEYGAGNKEIERLREEALAELPAYVTEENEARAWVARRILEICERERRSKQTLQALLITWTFNGEFGQIWMDHPDHPSTFKEFLQSVGSDAENNKLSPSVVSNMSAIAEVIVPFCKDNGIEVDGYLTTTLWTKFQEAIPMLKRAALNGDLDTINRVLFDVKALPTRDAMRAKYRKVRGTDTFAVSDIIYGKDRVVVVTVLDPDDLPVLKGVLSRSSSWEAIAAGSAEGKMASIKVSLE